MSEGVRYCVDKIITTQQFCDVLLRSGLGKRRPIDDKLVMAAMIDQASLMITCWRGEQLIGVARSLTDFVYCCYLADLAVDEAEQRRGIGKELIRLTAERLGDKCKIILLAAPSAETYYPCLKFEKHPQAWTILKSAILN